MPAKNLTRVKDEGIYCHIYNNGVDNRAIFRDDEDYKVFLGFLQDYLTPQNPQSLKKTFQVHGRTFQGIPHQPKNYFNKVELIAYSLTPERFQLLLHQLTEGSLENFIRSLCTRYSMYYNKKYQRNGALFVGPYKSVQIKDGLQLLQLTGDLHHKGTYTSYPEYLNPSKTTFIKPEVVLSFLNKGTDGYKDFVEKYEPGQKETELTDKRIEHHESILERRHPASSQDLGTDPNLKVHSRIPAFLTTSTVIFLLLVAFGVRNIQVSAVKINQPLPSPAVLAEVQEATPAAILQTQPELTPEVTSAATPEATAEAELKVEPEAIPETEAKIVTVRSEGGVSKINIRQKPTTASKKVGQAGDGDIFEFISFDSGWYKIKLTDGQSGFISEKYVVKEPNE